MLPTAHPDDATMARLTARMLWEVGAVAFRPEEPFILSSGKPSPTYIDCRRLIAFPRIRATLMDFLAAKVLREAGFEAFTAVAGGETAGIPFAAFLAERLALPMAYIRKKPKGYGRNARIEGALGPGDRALLVEDLATDGGSKLSFVEALREAGAECAHAAVVFSYGIFPETEATLAARGVTLHALATWADVLDEAKARGALAPGALAEVESFLADPHAWQAARA